MQIIHRLEDGLFSASTLEELKDRLHSFLISKNAESEVKIVGDTVVADVPSENIRIGQREFDEANQLCLQRKFAEAKPILERVVKKLPLWSEAYRTLAQVIREQGIEHVLRDYQSELCFN